MTRVSSHVDSLNKLAYAFKCVARQDFTFNGKFYAAPASIYISPLIFRKSWCPPMCAACCPRFSLDWIPEEERPSNIAGTRDVECNGSVKYLYSYIQHPNDGPSRFCDNVIPDTGMCGIHDNVPLSCDLPLLTFMVPTGTDRCHRIIGKKFSRAWNMMRLDGARGADCRIEDHAAALAEGKRDVVRKFKRMLKWCDYFRIPTHLPEIIAWCEEGPHEEPLSIVNLIPLAGASLAAPQPGDPIRIVGGPGPDVATAMPSEGVNRESYLQPAEELPASAISVGRITVDPAISVGRITVTPDIITAGHFRQYEHAFEVARMLSVSDMPIGEWYVTMRLGESGYNITKRIHYNEWTDLDGRTTVTHSTFLPPTHFLPHRLPDRIQHRDPIRKPYLVTVELGGGRLPQLNTRLPHWVDVSNNVLSQRFKITIAVKRASSVSHAAQQVLSLFNFVGQYFSFQEINEKPLDWDPFDDDHPRLMWMEW